MKRFFRLQFLFSILIWPLLFAVLYFTLHQVEVRLILANAATKMETTYPDDVQPDQFFLGQVISIDHQQRSTHGAVVINDIVQAKLLTGPDTGKTIEIHQDSTLVQTQAPSTIQPGEKAIIALIRGAEGGDQYFVADRYRLPALSVIIALFLTLVVALGRKRGIGSIFGLIFSIMVIGKLLVPALIAGKNPIVEALEAALLIAVVSLYLAHGFNKRTTIALVGTVITLGLSIGMAWFAVYFTKLLGMGSEEALYLQQMGPLGSLDLKDLLLAGIIIGALGVLDDTTTIQSATVEELKRANPSMNLRELYERGLSVGREHITSLVNTLVLAYAGSQLLLFLLFYSGPNQPLWVTLNSEFIAEEIVRTLVGSATLILAVPITTFLAAWYFSRRSVHLDAPVTSSVPHVH